MKEILSNLTTGNILTIIFIVAFLWAGLVVESRLDEIIEILKENQNE